MFSTRLGMFQTDGNFKTYVDSPETITITRSIVNATTVSFTFTNANLANTNVGYKITGADIDDFVDAVTIGQVTLDATGNATFTKTITTNEDIGTEKSFYVSAFGINNRINGVSGNVSIQTNQPMIATGGNSFIEDGNVFHVFTANSNLVVTQAMSGPAYPTVRALVVASGGSQFIQRINSSGAGAGGLRDANLTLSATTYAVTVGGVTPNGNFVGIDGANSSFANITARGGGGSVESGNGRSGGSGSGASESVGAVPGSGITGQGFRGGYGNASIIRCGGGGGAAAVGNDAGRFGVTDYGGNGGAGAQILWVPNGYGDPDYPKYFAGGGSAIVPQSVYSFGNKGPGGGGNGNGRTTGLGGIVIISYPNFTAFRSLTLP